MTSCRMYISGMIVMCLILSPLLSYSQRSRTEPQKHDELIQAETDAIADAKQDANFALWYSMGCLFSIFGVGAAHLMVPQSVNGRLIGKSMEYVWAYIESYKSTRRSLQTRYAIYGCLTSGTLMLVNFAIAISKEDTECCLTSEPTCEGSPDCSNPWPDYSCDNSDCTNTGEH